MKSLLTLTAILEVPTGAALVVAPALVSSVLLGVPLDAPAPQAVARVAGIALISLGVACWLARREPGSAAARGMVAAMLIYNLGVVGVLAYAALGDGLHGIGLWPAVGLHTVLAIWCGAGIAPLRR